MPENKHICFVLENFYPEHRAGTETYVYNLAKNLIKNSWKVSVIIAAIGKKSYEYNFEKISVYALSVPQKISVAELNGIQKPSNLTSFIKTLNKIKPEIVHFHSFSRSFTHFHLKEANNSGAKIFFTAHLGGIFCARGDLQLFGEKQCNAKIKTYRCSACYASQKYNKLKSVLGGISSLIIHKTNTKHKFPALNLIPYKLQSMQYLAKYTHQCIALAHWIEKAFLINNISQTTIITQAVDTSKFTVAPLKTEKQKLKIGFIGRMNPSKGLQILLKALSDNNLCKKINLEIITLKDTGELQFYTEIKTQFADLGYTQWSENLSHSEINEQMNDWDALILPSFHEVAPLTVLEAFAKKIPVISSNIKAFTETIKNNKNGIIFQNKNAEDLVLKLKNIIEKPQILRAMRKNIQPVRSFEELTSEHIKLYKN